jgi:Tol biopolymer transport system component
MTVKQTVGWRAMLEPRSAMLVRGSRVRRAALAGGAVALAAIALAIAPASLPARRAVSHAAEAVADLNPEPPRLAYSTESANGSSYVWISAASGTEPRRLGGGDQPLLAPNGQSVAASLFGATVGVEEQGPSLGIYPAAGGPSVNYFSLETAIATALAWSPDSRYLAVVLQSNGTNDIADDSGLDVVDTQTDTVKRIAAGEIYGASFARDGTDRLVFALSHSESFASGVNLYVSEADGAGLHRITSEGRSLHPVWGPKYIAYDRERVRHESPEYQIWLGLPSGARVRKLTHLSVGPLVQGLVPLAFSADGSRLVAEFEGEDTSEAYAVTVASGRARAVTVRGHAAQAAGISSDGSTLLLDTDGFEQQPARPRIVTMPFAGGPTTVLVAHGSQASWNR